MRPPALGIVAAFAAVYLIWGSTYLAIRICLETLPPFLMAGVRFAIAGAILLAWCLATGDERPSRAHVRSAVVVGALLLLCGNGGVVWAQQSVPSGLAALLVASVPLWMVGLDWLRPGGTRPSLVTSLGLALGLAGVALLVVPGRVGGVVDPVGAAVLLAGSGCWALGSILAPRLPLPTSPLLSTALQMLAGGGLLTLLGLATGEAARVDPASVSARSLLALLYLLVFGSLVAFSCYCWLLRVTTPARAATYAYVNPVVAMILGHALADEPLGPRVLAAAAIIVAGVVVITTARSRTAS